MTEKALSILLEWASKHSRDEQSWFARWYVLNREAYQGKESHIRSDIMTAMLNDFDSEMG